LAAHIVNFAVISVTITKKYRVEEWFIDLQKLFFEAGVENKQIVFLFGDGQIFDESILE
jgi:dynein heavy chain